MLTRSFMNPHNSRELLSYTPMIHARMFKENAKYRDRSFLPTRSGLKQVPESGSITPTDLYLDGRPDIDRPLTVQFCANDPDELLEAAKYVQPFCDAVDLNLGCPQGIARRGHYGAFLQEDWDLVYNLINTLHKNLDVPVTAKIRILETKEMTLQYAKKILDAGASILTVHGRQREQKGHKTGLADWLVIRYLREHLPPETVIFANGNILRHEDIARCLEATGADGVMSAEGNLYDPTIFAAPLQGDIDERMYWRGRDGRGGYRMDFVFRRYMSIIYKYVLESHEPDRSPLFSPSDPRPSIDSCEEKADPTLEPPSKKQKVDQNFSKGKNEKSTNPNISAMQPHLFHLLRPLVSVHTEVRDSLARAKTGDIAAFEKVLLLTEKAVEDGLLEYKANPEKFEEPLGDLPSNGDQEESLADYESSVRAVRSCKRPWFICQPYVRPLPIEALEKGSISLSKKEKQRLEEEANRARNDADQATKALVSSERPRLDVDNGVHSGQVASPAMVCG